MRNSPRAIVLGFAVLPALVLGPSAAFAGGQFGGHLDIRPGGFFARRPSTNHAFAPHLAQSHLAQSQPFGSHRFNHHHRFFHRPFAAFASSSVIYVAPPLSYGSVDYGAAAPIYDVPDSYPPSVVYSEPMTTAAIAPAPPPPPTVVEYATGRYELRGDGIAVPYTWQWVANAPPPPPAPPAAPPSTSTPAPQETKPVRHGSLYRWTDDQNVVYWTDNLESVPDEYRARVKQIPVR